MTQILLDIGNTQTVLGVSTNQEITKRFRFRTDPTSTPDELRIRLESFFPENGLLKTDRILCSSVVPRLESTLKEAFPNQNLLFIHHKLKREFELDLPEPSQLGADRLANVAGALKLFKPPFLIVDAGTATTFCAVDGEKKYFGGSIIPGWEISWNALFQKASKLSSVIEKHPESTFGNTTEKQLQIGMTHGYEVLIEGLVDRMCSENLNRFQNPKLLATGGVIHHMNLSSRFQFLPDLTLFGLLEYGRLNP